MSPQKPLNNQNVKHRFHKCFTNFTKIDYTAPVASQRRDVARKEFRLDVARINLGHRSAAITEFYAELDRDKAIKLNAGGRLIERELLQNH